METELSKLKENYIEHYCLEKKYSINKSQQKDHLRIDVSNMREKINLNLYHTGKVVVGGSPKFQLKIEFEEVKKLMDESPDILNGIEKTKVKACAGRYNILLPDTRNKIQESLSELGNTECIVDPTPSEEYRAKISSDRYSLSITQYKNGTLFLQGKADKLFNDTCDYVEKIATPSDEEIISRFFAGDEKSLEKFTSTYTPKLIDQATAEVKQILGDELFNFLEVHDQKWLSAAQCLRIVNIPLPEFSPIVMPASKAFEGFIKKLLVSINFFPQNHFNNKNASLALLNDTTNPARQSFVAKEKYADRFLKIIDTALDVNRNFMMHSDDNNITKLEQYDDAVSKLHDIHKTIKQIYNYFKNPVFGLA